MCTADKCTQSASLICLRGSGLVGARSPSGAPRRLLSERPNAPTQPRPCFTRTRGRRRYPRRQSRLSGAPRAPGVIPAGTMPKPPESGVTSPARRNRTRPIQRLSPVDVPEVGEIRMIVAQTGTDVNGNVTRHKTTGVARSVKRNPRSVIRPEGTSGTQMRGPQ